MQYDYDLVIIGSGPAGYIAAIRAGQVGLKTVIVEKAKIGGMCLNWGCIPTKNLLESAKKLEAVKEAADFGIQGIDKAALSFDWPTALKRSERIVARLTRGIEYLLKKNGVEIIVGEAEIVSEHEVSAANRLLTAQNIIIASGSRPAVPDYPLPPGLLTGIEELLERDSLPQKVAVMGVGPHAVELAQFFAMIGKEVCLLLPQGEPLLPGMDPYLEDYTRKLFKKAKIDIHSFSTLAAGNGKEGQLLVDKREIAVDLVINAGKRAAVLPRFGIAIALDQGFIQVNGFLQTNLPNIYAVGDVNGLSNLAHGASVQALHAVDVISGIKKEINLVGHPKNMYTYPEIAQVGLTEPQVKDKGYDYKISEFPLSANGKALAEGQKEGLIRVISEKQYGEVLGVQIIARDASDMISEAAAVLQLEGTVFDVAKIVHAHPTVSEIYMEAGFAAFDKPIHHS